MANDREKNGRFKKGHPPMFREHKPGHNAGRPKTIKGQVKDALKLAEDAMPAIIEEMIKRAQNPLDKDCQRASEYLMDRVYGKASLPIVSSGTWHVVYDKDEPSDTT